MGTALRKVLKSPGIRHWVNSRKRWRTIGSPGTFVEGRARPYAQQSSEEQYHIVALRRVTHPSLQQVLDRAVATANAVQLGDQSAVSPALYGAGIKLPQYYCAALASRAPESVIPFVGTAASVLSPLQLLGPVSCLRLYDGYVGGRIAQELYGIQDADPGGTIERFLTSGRINSESSSLRYLDTLWNSCARKWPPSPVALIANAKIMLGVSIEQDRTACEDMVTLMLGLPQMSPESLNRLPTVPVDHFDWGIALIMQASLMRR